MDFAYALLLGLVQGLTEFLPVSSTAHLVLVHEATGFSTANDPTFDIVLQLATAIAAVAYFRTDILDIVRSVFSREPEALKGKGLALTIVLGTIPAVIVGVMFEEAIEEAFRNADRIALALVAGSALMLAAEALYTRLGGIKPLTIGRGIVIGLFQALALVPGISRSGATISGGLMQGVERREAVRYSFLLSIPILFGASMKKLIGIDPSVLASFAGPLAVGFIASFVVGFASIHFLTSYLRKRTFHVFIWYRVVLAFAIALFL